METEDEGERPFSRLHKALNAKALIVAKEMEATDGWDNALLDRANYLTRVAKAAHDVARLEQGADSADEVEDMQTLVNKLEQRIEWCVEQRLQHRLAILAESAAHKQSVGDGGILPAA